MVYVVNMSLWFVNVVRLSLVPNKETAHPRLPALPCQITLDEFGTGFSFTISTVLANRLLISVREKYYAHHGEHSDWDTFTSMRFQTVQAARVGQGETIGMSTLSYGESSCFEAAAAADGSMRWGELTTQDRAEVPVFDLDNFSETRGF